MPLLVLLRPIAFFEAVLFLNISVKGQLCLLSYYHIMLTTGTVPPTLKLAAITPILKKPGADPTDLNHYRPISNLPFISKTLERVVAAQLQSHLDTNNLHEPFQSGFRPKHSTETALVKITNDLLLAADSGLFTILILLDLSAAFDTISHPLLLDRLAGIGITGAALSWFTSYLTGRQQFVQLSNHKSGCSVPYTTKLAEHTQAFLGKPGSTEPQLAIRVKWYHEAHFRFN